MSDPAGDVEFRHDVTVELVKSSASDSDVLFAARVSTKGEQSLEDVDADATRSTGLINYLMRDRHGCYDSETEVLTRAGWVAWPDVRGDEEFLTLSPSGTVEYQRALRLVRKDYTGPMVRLRKEQLDLLVTPDHRMWAKRRRQPAREAWELVPARDLLEASHRIALGGGTWSGEALVGKSPAWFALLGFFIGDGHSADGGTPQFHLRKAREIAFLRETAPAAGYSVTERGDRFYLLADQDFRLYAKRCYESGEKVVPAEVLDAPQEALRALLDGLLASDGSCSPTSGKLTYCTTSRRLAGQVQEVALKAGWAAVVIALPRREGDGHYGRKPVFHVTLHRGRRATPRVGWTRADREREVTLEQYAGQVHCVSVPNGTLYVRRNGKPAWCGNSPFEHTSLTFYVQAPIFVFREFMRHRIASYNEESGRYRELRPVFYVPGPERRLVQEGKPGQYRFVAGTDEQHRLVDEETRAVCREAYASYQRMLDAGVAREVARIVLPVTIFSSMYVTMNARALMNFLSLRTKREDSHFPSFPQREIEMVAERMEDEWRRLMPVTAAAFDANGRVAP